MHHSTKQTTKQNITVTEYFLKATGDCSRLKEVATKCSGGFRLYSRPKKEKEKK